ncbi:hypothetical protein DPMN_047164 [Dreissena polymorpha]|uniref:Uncharacterized protein n=1 Tax=Dreissena polymorpha TaxID=45954 RepID=A0A9D4D7J7_DREPO|nr:hypothetical protein DPMN_047164 [Dreissena polymorpha]
MFRQEVSSATFSSICIDSLPVVGSIPTVGASSPHNRHQALVIPRRRTCRGFDPHCGSVISPQQTPSTSYTQEADTIAVQ